LVFEPINLEIELKSHTFDNMSKAVIIGDIIKSREQKAGSWIENLKKVLSQYGNPPSVWEIFRGDSFQLMLDPIDALLAAIHIRAFMKHSDSLDVRMAIGIGEVTHKAAKITESNGSAFVFSGECFESLKKQTLALKTGDQEIDLTLNVMLKLALLTIDNWTPKVAGVIKTALEQPKSYQKDIARLLGTTQSNISETLNRGGFYEIMQMNDFYRNKISSL
jgi:hypothetical protein